MRLIDADALLVSIDDHSYQVYHGVGYGDVDYGMTVDGIKQCIDEAPTIVMGKNAETCIPNDEADSRQDAAKPETARPHICDVLGVDVNEEFSFNSETRRYKRAKVNERGRLIAWDDSGDCWNCVGNHGICWLINHPDALRKRSKAKLIDDETVKTEPRRPHICDVLGVEVGEKFRLRDDSVEYPFPYHITQQGIMVDHRGRPAGTDRIFAAINGKVTAVAAGVELTNREEMICRALGARWVSQEVEDGDVTLWDGMPTWNASLQAFVGKQNLASVEAQLFPSMHGRMCLEVPG